MNSLRQWVKIFPNPNPTPNPPVIYYFISLPQTFPRSPAVAVHLSRGHTGWSRELMRLPSWEGNILSPDELVKHSRTVGALLQHQRAAVEAQQHLLEHGALQLQDQSVNLDHLHLVCAGRLHPQRHVAAVSLNQQGFQALQQGQRVADGVPAAATSILSTINFLSAWLKRKRMEFIHSFLNFNCMFEGANILK